MIAALVAVTGLAGANQAYAQGAEPGRTEISVFPGGGLFFREATDTGEPSFNNYGLGGAVAVNFNRYVGVEGEVGGALGYSQDLELGGLTTDLKTPHMLNYSGNLVLSAPNRSAFVPYAAGGIGGLSLFERSDVGVSDTTTFLMGNVGGGVKWYGGRWGLRADYRFIGVRSQDEAPAFFGRETRYGHRVYWAVLVNLAQ
jgi:hypothetical protein